MGLSTQTRGAPDGDADRVRERFAVRDLRRTSHSGLLRFVISMQNVIVFALDESCLAIRAL